MRDEFGSLIMIIEETVVIDSLKGDGGDV